jgi:cytochrome c oxidase subunit 1/cytochrome c oxidase subunit I+III
VAQLPSSALDHRSEVWWGNLLLIGIETTMFALLVAGYFYVRPNFAHWPPPQPHTIPPRFDPVPALGLPTVNLGLLLFTLVPALVADRACLRRQRGRVTAALTILIGLTAVCIALRFREFSSLHFRWDDNAYGSFVWTIVGLHLLHLFVGVLEFTVMLAWIAANGLDDKHARDVRVTAGYWYWVVGVWVVLYAIVFPGPRFF